MTEETVLANDHGPIAGLQEGRRRPLLRPSRVVPLLIIAASVTGFLLIQVSFPAFLACAVLVAAVLSILDR